MKKKLNSVFWIAFLVIFLEFVYKATIIGNVFSFNSLITLLFSIPTIIALGFITSSFKERINKLLLTIITLALSLLFISQVVYFNFYDSIFSVSLLTKGTGNVLQFYEEIFSMTISLWYIVVIILIPLVLYFIFRNKIFSYETHNKQNLKRIFISMPLALLICLFLILADSKSIYSLKNLFTETHAPILTIEKVGLLTTEGLDITRFIFDFEETARDTDKRLKYFNNEEYNVLNIDFKELIEKEEDETIKAMHKYFGSLDATKKNEYTGILKDKNLVFITAESFFTGAINETLTPNLYKLYEGSIKFNNYYQPLFPFGTSDGEFMNLTSLVPVEGLRSAYESSKINMPFALGNMFKEIGYNTNGYHNHAYESYLRISSHSNMGFKYNECGIGLEKRMTCGEWTNSDNEMLQATFEDYIGKDKKFATYYMTLSAHLSYYQDDNLSVKRNWEKVKDLNYSEKVKGYLAANIELDKGIGNLINELKKYNLMDDTVIVIAPDHYPYGLSNSELNELYLSNKNEKYEKNRNSLIIYNKDLTNIEVNKYVSSIDILPTLYNLFGLEYDSRLLMGRDALSDGEGLVMLTDRSFITDEGKLNSFGNKFYPFDKEKTVSKEYINIIKEKVYQKFSMSSLILSTDYYGKLVYENK